MAKAQFNPEVTETRVIEEASVTLTLTLQEARAVQTIVSRSNGSILCRVYDALDDAGVLTFPNAQEHLGVIPFLKIEQEQSIP